MEQARKNWLNKAAVIVASIVLAASLAIGFAPANAWGDISGVPFNNQLKITAKGTITKGSDVQNYSNSTAGFESIGSGSEVIITAAGGQLTACDSTSARTKIESYEEGLENFLNGAGEGATIVGPSISVKYYYSIMQPSLSLGVFDSLEEAEQAYNDYLTGGGSVSLSVINKYFEVTITGSATIEESSSSYEMTSGNGSAWTKGSTDGLTFVSNAPFDKFENIIVVDNEAVDPQYWTAEAGSTKVTLKSEFLETLAVGSHSISIVSSDAVTQGTFIVAESGSPQIINGANKSWAQGSTTGLTFRSNGEFADFTGVLVDGNEVPADQFTARSGSTIVTLLPSYLAQLSLGTHTISIGTAGEWATANFTIVGAAAGGTGTGDGSGVQAAGYGTGTTAKADASMKSPKTGGLPESTAAATLAISLCALAAGALILRARKDGSQ